ncbi:hypothetical protein ZHAS_00000203 [Anopheles sinensis]|uniref:Uncharacterized protein n=1 Tax=Anopheles sinensis TaxID=74873 RepID=A0A084VA04_ANOSI|nr:hypothetical protein ZHAS_00000203 [Anopheles sinensis]
MEHSYKLLERLAGDVTRMEISRRDQRIVEAFIILNEVLNKYNKQRLRVRARHLEATMAAVEEAARRYNRGIINLPQLSAILANCQYKLIIKEEEVEASN